MSNRNIRQHGALEHGMMYDDGGASNSSYPDEQFADDYDSGYMQMQADPSMDYQQDEYPKNVPLMNDPHSSAASHMYAVKGKQMIRIEKRGMHLQQPQMRHTSYSIASTSAAPVKYNIHSQQPSSSQSSQSSFSSFTDQQYSASDVGPRVDYDDASSAASYSNDGFNYVSQIKTEMKPKAKKRSVPGQRKPCNCTKSMCLKLYCDCFANGEFCRDCNCKDCHNNMEHESDRSRAIKQSLERNPHAFRPKIGIAAAHALAGRAEVERQHQKGCHCKKSGCLKNYCECYEAKVPCTDKCKCRGCQNTESDRVAKLKDKLTNSALMNLANAASSVDSSRLTASPLSDEESDDLDQSNSDPRAYPWFFMTDDVIGAATLCMIAQAEEVLSRGDESNFSIPSVSDEVERMVLREFGRCLDQIIQSAHTMPPPGAQQVHSGHK